MPLKKNQEIRLPGKRKMRWKGKDLRVLVNDDVLKKPRRMAFHESVRLGYGESCEFHLGGEDGPPVVLELRKRRGPAHLSSPLSPEDLDQYVELSVDGEPVRSPARRLAPGTLLEILDKRTDRRIRLLVDPPSFLLRHPRMIATLLALAFLTAAGYGLFLQMSLNSTENRLRQTEVRLGKAETIVERAERSVSEALGRLKVTENQQARALREFHADKTAAEQRLVDSFNVQFDGIRKDFSQRLAEISQEDGKARTRLETDTRQRIEALKTALSRRMVEGYNRAKSNEAALRKSVIARLAAVEPESRVFKRTYSQARNKVLFIRVEYKVRFEPSSEVREFDGFGTGFLMSSRGLGVTARHVLFPWEYDRQLAVFQKAGVAELMPGSIRVTVWPTDRRAHDNNPDTPRYFSKRGYHSGGKNPSFRFLFAPRPERAEVVSNTPFGLVTVTVPIPGRTDIAVFQVKPSGKRLPFFRLARTPLKVETLDEVMAVGYPFARLQNGVTIPQPARGIIRRIGGNLIELDTPLHPGVSGGPVVNRAGRVIGMAIGVMDTPVYGMAVSAKDIRSALRRARNAVRKDERRLRKLGCNPGHVDGVITGKTWAAYACEAARGKARGGR